MDTAATKTSNTPYKFGSTQGSAIRSSGAERGSSAPLQWLERSGPGAPTPPTRSFDRKGSATHNLTITFDNSMLAPTQTASNLGAMQVLVQALVISHLDYCNSLLVGQPASAIRHMQLIQNPAGL
ncbi:unnamed protein product [Pleuronectes platessa]|uniref:Uncharacterized protein n=1 Tax=Pleuronectes platessa TaxID=8262 RepID=A0A9N7UKE2_PLEPL|nr:unnamed protein product [Pleuronectes platessa]